jgi:hypothetical protein
MVGAGSGLVARDTLAAKIMEGGSAARLRDLERRLSSSGQLARAANLRHQALQHHAIHIEGIVCNPIYNQ